MNKIVFMDGDIPSTYFPVGPVEEGGTCAYLTPECWEYCPSSQITNSYEVEALRLIKEYDVDWIAQTIINELDGQKLLQWNVWGDCLPELTDKMSEIVSILNDNGIKQFGFTRNHNWWNRVKHTTRIGLTVDTEYQAFNFSYSGLVCWPDPDRSEARLHWKGKIVAKCSGWWCTYTDTGEMHNSACRQCISEHRGCFYE